MWLYAIRLEVISKYMHGLLTKFILCCIVYLGGRFMRRIMFFVLFGIMFTANIFSQNILPNYNGFWSQAVYPWDGPSPIENGRMVIRITDILDYYPDNLSILRNEIFARYGRPFLNQRLREHFFAQGWYIEKEDFSNDWLTERDMINADFIQSIENAPNIYDAIIYARRNGIIYEGVTFNLHFPLFALERAVYGSENYDEYVLDDTRDWIVAGDWIIIYEPIPGSNREDRYQAVSFRIDPNTKRIIDFNFGSFEGRYFRRFLARQEPIKIQYTRDW